MDEEVLAGGNVTPVVRIGDTVRREAGAWTPAVHRLLAAYAAARIAETPRPHGLDAQGREILDHLPGHVLASSPSLWSPDVLEQTGRLLRRLHDASTPLIDEQLPWRLPAHPPVEVICHNDFAPYNLIAQGDTITGVIDMDMASPGSRLWDLAYLAYRLVPYAEDADSTDDGTRLRRLLAAYGIDYTEAEVHAMIAERLDDLATFTEARAAETGRSDLAGHAAMYRRDAARLR